MKFKYIFLCLFFGVVFLAAASVTAAFTAAFAFAAIFLFVLGTILIVFQLDKAYSEKE